MNYLSNIITQVELDKIIPGQFNILRAPCGSGKTTFMFDDRILGLARAKKHVLYLIHNKITRDFIAKTHTDKARVFTDCNCSGWFDARKHPGSHLWTNEDEDYVHVMCYQTFAALLRNEGPEWLDDIDLIVWDEFDDFRSFYESEVKRAKKLLPDFSREKLVALLQKGKANSTVNFIYQLKTRVLDAGKIRLLAVSATPEIAASYFEQYINYIIAGRLECKYDAKDIFFVDNVKAALRDGTFKPNVGRRYWCYTKYVTEGREIEAVARDLGFQTIMLWSNNNDKHRADFTEEKQRVINIIRDEHIVPQPYDFIITTGVLGRGVDIYDLTVQDWICNSTDYEEVAQFIRARFSPERGYLLKPARGLVDFVQKGFDEEYYKWHSMDELRKLIREHPIFSRDSETTPLKTFNAIRKEYPDLWERRRYGRAGLIQYRLKKIEDDSAVEDTASSAAVADNEVEEEIA